MSWLDLFAIIATEVASVLIIISFMKDKKHDLEIKVGEKIRISIKIHEKE